MNLSLPQVKNRSLLVTIVLLLSACQAGPGPQILETARPAEPATDPLPEGRVYVVDSAASELRIVVGTAGTMARFGHPHVIGGPALSGRVVVTDDWRHSVVQLNIRVSDLELDRPAWRIAEGFEADLPADAVEATRNNLLSEAVLDAGRHPVITIRSTSLRGPAFQPDLTVHITLRDQTREQLVPVALEWDDDRLIATGRFTLRQSDYGLTPFSALGGALAVSDALLVRFRVVAEPAE